MQYTTNGWLSKNKTQLYFDIKMVIYEIYYRVFENLKFRSLFWFFVLFKFCAFLLFPCTTRWKCMGKKRYSSLIHRYLSYRLQSQKISKDDATKFLSGWNSSIQRIHCTTNFRFWTRRSGRETGREDLQTRKEIQRALILESKF